MRIFLLLQFIFFSISVFSQVEVKGRVTSLTEPGGLPGVNIIIKGTSLGTVTDFEGRFTLSSPPDAILVFTFVGYKDQEVNVQNRQTLDVVLVESPYELNEVIVVGYSSIEKRDITGSIATIKTDKFKEISINGVDQALQG